MRVDPLLHHRISIAAPGITGLVLKALGLVQGASLHTWLLDVGQNLGWGGAIGGFFSAAAAAAGWPGFFKGEPPPFYGPPSGPPTPPPDFKHWSPADQKKWIQNMVQNRRENPPPKTLMQWFTTGVQSISGASDTTTAANGCTKG
jgi:hypothetical protein